MHTIGVTNRNQVKATHVKQRRWKENFVMKREFLKELGLTDEQIDKVMAENGKDIENAKGNTTELQTELKTKETELETLQEQLKNANKQIEEFKDMDIDAIQKAADDYKEKYETAKTEAEEELEKIKFEYALDKALGDAKAKNTKAVKALLELDNLKMTDEKILGLDEQLESIKKENDFLFEYEQQTPTFVLPGNNLKGDENEVSIGAKLAKNVMEQSAEKQDSYFE